MAFLPNNEYGKPLGTEKQQQNAFIIWQKARAMGWSLNAVAAMLGNWQSESTLNANRPQSGWTNTFPNPNSAGSYGGFGLPQWTTWNNKIGWYAQQRGLVANQTNTNPWSDIDLQLEYHEFECTNGLKGDSSRKTWYQRGGVATGKYVWYPWQNFKTSTDSPRVLANTYYWVYEFSSAYDPGERLKQAENWYKFLSGQPLPPSGGTKKSNFIPIAYSVGLFK